MSYVETVAESEASGALADLYTSAKARFNLVPDAIKITSLRPEVTVAIDNIRKVLLGDASSIGARCADLIGTVISGMNHCEYCGTAHAGMLKNRGELNEDEAVQAFRDWRKLDLSAADRVMLEFAEKITFQAAAITQEDIDLLKDQGFSDENVVDIVLLCAWRNFMNRVNDGLGASTERIREKFGDDLSEAISMAAKL